MPEQEIKALFSQYPEALYGFADAAYSPYGEQYRSALVFAVPYGRQLTLEEYTEEAFDGGIQAARAVIERIVPRIGEILDRHQIAYWVPPVAQKDEIELLAPFSFKTAAVHAGLGWIGKNDVLITSAYGPRVRLSAVLIDAGFAYGQRIEVSRCPADCTACVDACPCHALKNHPWTINTPRDAIIDYHRCNRMRSADIKRLGRKNACGRCLAACPVGRNE